MNRTVSGSNPGTPSPLNRIVAISCGLVALAVLVGVVINLFIPDDKDVATTSSDYDHVCSGGGILSAAEHRPGAGPHPRPEPPDQTDDGWFAPATRQ